ncbi:MAG: MAPEG family protein [Agarilytica sp.]
MNYYWFAVCVSLNGLFLLLLAFNVSRIRLRHRISYGDGDNKQLNRAIRVHCNGVEQVPIFALLTLALTLTGATQLVLSSAVISFTLARVSHAYGMLFSQHIFRRIGAGVTYITQFLTAIALLISISV